MTQITVDGVVQGNGGRNENRSGGFERGGWAMGVFDDETASFITETYERADAFLFGRKTYEHGRTSRFEGRDDPGSPAERASNVRTVRRGA